ncbi:MAG: hypothetical protein J3Q66DRAFT_411256 [Benniella sp.]|nr:MAG: hypothetical protein J3Q66DRAFT_411256 [Benniella sp.]
MSEVPSQAFRAQSSSKVISIHTRLDKKSGTRIILWRDIQRLFKHAEFIMHGQDIVLFLTDDDFEELVPQRIAHFPGVVLEVLMSDDGQSDSLSLVARPVESDSSQKQVVSSSRIPESTERDGIATRISGGVDSQALVKRARDPSESVIQGMHTSGAGHSRLRSESNMSQQEQPRQLHQQIQQLQLQMQQLQQQMEKTQQSQQHIQGQMDEIPQNFERMDQLILQSQQSQQQQMDRIIQKEQRMDQRLQQVDDAMQTIRQQDPLTPDQSRQETMQVLDRFAHVQYCIQDILHRSFQRSPIPRLFILLPEPAVTKDGCGTTTTPLLHFRLYFLCQCGAHTMAKDFNEPHEVHLTEHHGYKLTKQDEFIREYGQYILGMMYMVKYGAKTEGLAIPPLLGIHHATVPAGGQEHLRFFKKNIRRLVDDTITHLEEVFRALGRDPNAAAHQKLGSRQLSQVKQYLTIKGEDNGVESGKDTLMGDLSQTMTQDGRCVWVCSKHKLRKADELTEQPMIDPQAIKDSDPLGIKTRCDQRAMGVEEKTAAVNKVDGGETPHDWLTREDTAFSSIITKPSRTGPWYCCPKGHVVSILGLADSFVDKKDSILPGPTFESHWMLEWETNVRPYNTTGYSVIALGDGLVLIRKLGQGFALKEARDAEVQELILQRGRERQQQQGQPAWIRKEQETLLFGRSSLTYHGSFAQATHGPQGIQEPLPTVMVSHQGSEEGKPRLCYGGHPAAIPYPTATSALMKLYPDWSMINYMPL